MSRERVGVQGIDLTKIAHGREFGFDPRSSAGYDALVSMRDPRFRLPDRAVNASETKPSESVKAVSR